MSAGGILASIGTKVFAGLCAFAVGLLIAMPNVAGALYNVDVNPYSATGVVSAMGETDFFVLKATKGTEVAYSVAAAEGGCVIVTFEGGDWTLVAVGLQGSEGCVPSYSNTFSVGSSGWTEFLVGVRTNRTTDVAYTLNISVGAPALDPTPLTLVAVIALVAVFALVAVVWVVRTRRRTARATATARRPPLPQRPPQQPP